MTHLSPLQQMRLSYQPLLPKALQDLSKATAVADNSAGKGDEDQKIASLFPHSGKGGCLHFQAGKSLLSSFPLRIGVVLSGGQAPGGHNVITGLFDALQKIDEASTLIGFLDGPKGIIEQRYIELSEEVIAPYRNQGGFDLLGSGRDKIEKPAHFQAAAATCKALELDGLVFIGGDDSNTNAALLAEYFAEKKMPTVVVGVPKTIDGDLKNAYIEVSFGFDTACKIYSEIIGNLMRDALSAKKHYYFVKLMGRAASHIALECALKTHPNLTFISEEVAASKKTLQSIVNEISDLIQARSIQGKDYGVILIPEGLIEFIPEIQQLILELNELLAQGSSHHSTLSSLEGPLAKVDYVAGRLTSQSRSCFLLFPQEIQLQMLLGRDAHGNVQVSKIETERLLIALVKKELKARKEQGSYRGSFNPQAHFCGYEGRAGLPSNFDCQYCYGLGHVAALLVKAKANGYIAVLQGLTHPVDRWQPGGIPLISMMNLEKRHGDFKPVIQKALVDLKGRPYAAFIQQERLWKESDSYLCPGPIQFFGPSEFSESISETLLLEQRSSTSTS